MSELTGRREPLGVVPTSERERKDPARFRAAAHRLPSTVEGAGRVIVVSGVEELIGAVVDPTLLNRLQNIRLRKVVSYLLSSMYVAFGLATIGFYLAVGRGALHLSDHALTAFLTGTVVQPLMFRIVVSNLFPPRKGEGDGD